MQPLPTIFSCSFPSPSTAALCEHGPSTLLFAVSAHSFAGPLGGRPAVLSTPCGVPLSSSSMQVPLTAKPDVFWPDAHTALLNPPMSRLERLFSPIRTLASAEFRCLTFASSLDGPWLIFVRCCRCFPLGFGPMFFAPLRAYGDVATGGGLVKAEVPSGCLRHFFSAPLCFATFNERRRRPFCLANHTGSPKKALYLD